MSSTREKGFTVLDAVITLSIIGVLVGIVVPRYQRLAFHAQEAALKTGLVNIRTSIRLFRMLNNRNPASLKEMVEKKALLPARIGPDTYTGQLILKESYLMEYAVDKNGNIMDSFGNPFYYDADKGEVRAATKGYESW